MYTETEKMYNLSNVFGDCFLRLINDHGEWARFLSMTGQGFNSLPPERFK